MTHSKHNKASAAGPMFHVDGELSPTAESTNLAGHGIGRFRADPLGFMLRLTSESSAFYTGAGWRAYHNYIGSRIFYPEYSSEIRGALLKSDRLEAAVKNVSLVRFREARSKKSIEMGSNKKAGKGRVHDLTLEMVELDTRRQLVKMMNIMVAEMNSMRSIRFIAFVINSVLVRMYHQGIHIREAEFLQLHEVAQHAAKNKISMIFLPCHKSHVDYLVISYIFYRLGLALPHIAAGDNLNLPGIGSLLRKGGAFFIKRQWGDDPLYGILMREYIELLLARGHNIEAFIEGTRSRIGKLLQPKFGILKMVLDAVLSGRTKDVILVPMSIGYDKVIETESYVNELLGTPKEKESLSQLLNNINILSFKWGRIDIRFSKPYSLNAYIKSQIKRRGSEFNPANVVDDKILLLQTLGYRILSDINAASVIMPTALVGTILLTLRGRGVGHIELIRKVNWLKGQILSKGGRVADFGGISTGIIAERAVKVLKELIGTRVDLLEPVYYPVKRFELSFYRNQVIHLFISEAILSTAMYATVKNGGPVHAQRVLYRPDLVFDVAFISSLLKTEFVYGPGGLERNLEATVKQLQDANVISIENEDDMDGDQSIPAAGSWERRKWVSLSPEERRFGRETFDFYCFLLWPFIETYWLAAVSLFSIVPGISASSADGSVMLNWVDEKTFMNQAQHFGKTLYYEGDLSYFESVNKETLKNAILRLKQKGIIIMRKSASQPATMAASQPEPSTPSASPGSPPATSAASSVNWIAIAPGWIPPESLLIASNTMPADLKSGNPSGSPKGVSPNTTLIDDSSKRESGKSSPEKDPDWDPWHDIKPSGRLWDFCEQIGRFRREGKNRRDTGTVAVRIFRLAAVAGRWVDSKKGRSKAKEKDIQAEKVGEMNDKSGEAIWSKL